MHLITFRAEPVDAIVDGRDFVFTLFQLGDPAKARPVAERLFGPGISRYLDRAWATDSHEQRIAQCRVAVQDDAVVEAHAANRTVIAGRLGTVFRNAFLVWLPIALERIIDVRSRYHHSPRRGRVARYLGKVSRDFVIAAEAE